MFSEINSISFLVFSAKLKIWRVSVMLLLLFGAENNIMTTFGLKQCGINDSKTCPCAQRTVTKSIL